MVDRGLIDNHWLIVLMVFNTTFSTLSLIVVDSFHWLKNPEPLAGKLDDFQDLTSHNSVYFLNIIFITVFIIITELVYICLVASWRMPLGARISRWIEDLLVTCCLFYGPVVVSLWHIPHFHSQFYLTLNMIKTLAKIKCKKKAKQ